MYNYAKLAIVTATWALLVFSGGDVRVAVSAPDMKYLDNGTIKIGVDLNLGGSITCLMSDTGNTMNLVNSADTGREIQQSYYSDSTVDTWNPVQAGDRYGNHSTVLNWNNSGSELYVKTRPLLWLSNNVPAECIMENWITVSDNVATVRNRLTNLRTNGPETLTALTMFQELPAVYTVGTLSHLKTYTGIHPFTGGDATEITTGDPTGWKTWRATENWAAYVNDSNYGLGVYHPGVGLMQGGFAGTRDVGGPTDTNTGYISPLRRETLDHNIIYDYSYQLIVGSLDNVRSYVNANQPDTRPDYHFTGDRQGWTYEDSASDTGFPIGDHLHVEMAAGPDPLMMGPICAFQASDVQKLYVRAAYHLTNPTPDQLRGEIYWETNNGWGDSTEVFSATQRCGFDIIPDGQYHTYELDLASVETWSGLITALRFDPAMGANAGDYVDVQFISCIPEPSTLTLLVIGLIGLLAYVWRRRT